MSSLEIVASGKSAAADNIMKSKKNGIYYYYIYLFVYI
jgi:hypothetical protein